MTKVIIMGIAGRMGSRIGAICSEHKDIQLIGGVEKKGHPAVQKDIGSVIGIGEIGIKITDSLQDIISSGDVVIDFTHREATIENVKVVESAKKAMVIGTTGLSKEDMTIIKTASTSTPIIQAPNMSVGVNLLLKVLKDIAVILGDDYDVEIVELHHRMKKDAPSGTALKMAQVISDSLGRNLDDVAVYARKGIIGERTQKEIGIQTVRAGDIVGEHTVYFGGLGERIEITHKASSRDTFARGAVRAALWIKNQKPGLYDMMDVLGLK
ncbi:MAG: 4-hydroxy-tetrahydrodipicolinate reductase [Thermodesulfovibrionales bacterium]|nr:4-hydroxy-tetrahydrodipicolinate reductase [Thermodesulfovibrionales bacterium]